MDLQAKIRTLPTSPGVYLYKDPEGNTVEYTAEVEQITDPDRQPRVMEPYPDQWRSASSH